MAQELQVTSAQTWRTQAKEGFVTELPSGNVARIRRTMNLFDMLEKGEIPNPLAGRIKEMINAGSGGIPTVTGPDADEAVPQLLDLIADQVVQIFVEPRVERQPKDWDVEKQGKWEPSEGAIAIDDITMQDRMFVFAFAQGMALDLEAFRRQSEEIMATPPNVARLAADPGEPAVSDGPVPGVLPERGSVDVRSPRRGADERGGSRPAKAASKSGGKNKGASGGATKPRRKK